MLPTPHRLATGIGAGRLALGGTFLVAPVLSVRVLGMDTATAKRVTYLARMTAGRDIVLGLGTLAAGDGPAAVPWLLAGAAADAVDAVVIAAALRGGRTKGVLAAAIAAGAAVAAGVAVAAAVSLRQARSANSG